MLITKNTAMLELRNEMGCFYPILIWDPNDLVLIDTGLPEMREMLINEIKKQGFSHRDVTKLILTHQDVDHTGNAQLFAEMGVKIYAPRIDAPYIEGKTPLSKFVMLDKNKDNLSPIETIIFNKIKESIAKCVVPVDYYLEDQETLNFCNGLKVICTKGHTPGHISVLLTQENILVAGDCANIRDNVLIAPDPSFCTDPEEALLSFKKITTLPLNGIVCYHSGFLKM